MMSSTNTMSKECRSFVINFRFALYISDSTCTAHTAVRTLSKCHVSRRGPFSGMCCITRAFKLYFIIYIDPVEGGVNKG